MGLSGARRSLALTGSLLAGLLLLAPLARLWPALELPALLGRLWVFPHASFMSGGTFPDRPATALPFGVALLLALVQWGAVMAGVARLSRDWRLRNQGLLAFAAVLGVGFLVLVLGTLLGGERLNL